VALQANGNVVGGARTLAGRLPAIGPGLYATPADVYGWLVLETLASPRSEIWWLGMWRGARMPEADEEAVLCALFMAMAGGHRCGV